jgi:DNA-binding MarR family transcriptional regulator
MATQERESAESAVARALSLLTAFTFTDPVLGVSELGRRVKLPKSTVHRLLGILVAEGFVERTPDERYRLSLKLYEIGQEVVSSRVLRQVGHVPLEKLHNDSNEATHLAVLSGADVVYLDRLESPQMIGVRLTGRRGRCGRRRAAAPRPANDHHSHSFEPSVGRGTQGRLRGQHRRGRAGSGVDRGADLRPDRHVCSGRLCGRAVDPNAGGSTRSVGADGGAHSSGDIEGTRQRPGRDPLTIDTPSSDVDGTRHNRVGSPSTSDSHVPHSPLSHPRFGLSYLARNRIAKSADTSDHVANEKWRPSISNATSRSNDLDPWPTVTALTVRAVSTH